MIESDVGGTVQGQCVCRDTLGGCGTAEVVVSITRPASYLCMSYYCVVNKG